MTEVVGTIAACLELTLFIKAQVTKFVDAADNLKAISNDVELTGNFLAQLEATLKKDKDEPATARRPSKQGVETAARAIEKCHNILNKMKRLIIEVLGSRIKDDGKVYGSIGTRTRFRQRESKLLGLKTELKECELHIVLANSILTLGLSKQPSQQDRLHPRDQVEIANLTLTVGLIWEKLNKPSNAQPAVSQPPKSPDSVNPITVQAGGDKGLGHSPGNSATGVDRGNIARIQHSPGLTDALNRQAVRWLNDPFDRDMINIFDVTDQQLQRLVSIASQLPITPRTALGQGTSTTHYADEGEPVEIIVQDPPMVRLYDREDKERRKETVVRGRAEAQILRTQEQQPTFSSNQELVDYLINSWTTPTAPSSSDSAKLKPQRDQDQPSKRRSSHSKSPSPNRRSITACGHRFKPIEPMFHCSTCALGSTVVLCGDCFEKSDHYDHDWEEQYSRSGQSVCDCGDSTAFKRSIRCKKHGETKPAAVVVERER